MQQRAMSENMVALALAGEAVMFTRDAGIRILPDVNLPPHCSRRAKRRAADAEIASEHVRVIDCLKSVTSL